MFLDGSHLITPELSNRIDAISQQVQGFYFGRFDIRYSSVSDLKAGKDFYILELNGATSESTNIYDPSWSVMQSYRLLFLQWKILFKIGKQNIERGEKRHTLVDLIKVIFRFYSDRKMDLISG
jgi:hypothetical protein